MECIPFACPSCGARMYFVQETKATTYDMWLFSDDGSSLYKKLPLSEALLQEPLLKAEIKTSSFLLCPNCGSKYANLYFRCDESSHLLCFVGGTYDY